MNKPLNLLTVAITGANSYIGQNFIKFCLNNKINVKAICRNPDKLNINFAKEKGGVNIVVSSWKREELTLVNSEIMSMISLLGGKSFIV